MGKLKIHFDLSATETFFMISFSVFLPNNWNLCGVGVYECDENLNENLHLHHRNTEEPKKGWMIKVSQLFTTQKRALDAYKLKDD